MTTGAIKTVASKNVPKTKNGTIVYTDLRSPRFTPSLSFIRKNETARRKEPKIAQNHPKAANWQNPGARPSHIRTLSSLLRCTSEKEVRSGTGSALKEAGITSATSTSGSPG